ncbi:hypothetical protein [Enterovibrio coralii]|uniref:Uncharacterized protein n=1 Tax=Enterovibrio coralii TaxID=294935 RepID=A0A135IBK6_9GAMM|nr:hypothetical protein [Enterovibrio coralii]KXF82819.1 hypothetical protein ATN88_23375 [Enterovibrio coralii]
MGERISEQQAQMLSDFIADKCVEMDLGPEQILDGLSRVLLGATNDLGVGGFELDIEGFGRCSVELVADE